MFLFHRPGRSVAIVAAAVSALALAAPAVASAEPSHGHHSDDRGQSQVGVKQTNLISDRSDVGASLVDPDAVNPWGLALGPTTTLWSANAGNDTSTLYRWLPGEPAATKLPNVRVTFPDKPELPTGQVFNGTTGFALSSAADSQARFIFSTITGRIEAWSPVVDPAIGNAETKATVPGASYTGLALATASSGPQLYAANPAQGRVDVFDSAFALQPSTGRQFRDNDLPDGYAPFGIASLDGNIFVSYAKVDPVTHHDVAGRGLGFVDEYTPEGRLVGRVASRHTLNAPWGMEIAPPSWGRLAGDLLVGNFGDGRINVIAAEHHGRQFQGHFAGQLRNDKTGRTLVIPGLWSLLRGTATTGGTDSIWFSAGIDDEQHGLIGVLRR